MSRGRWVVALVPLLFVLALGGGILFREGEVLSFPGLDLARQFAAQREFGFGEVARGNLPLWNPHLFLGMPALGNIQMALLYPPNLIFLVFPLGLALNLSLLLHLALGGVLMGAWLLRSGVGRAAAAVGGVLYLGCGANYGHLFGGHLTMVCLLAWAPLLFLALDGIVERGGVRPALAGVLALTMMVLAGYPQFVYHLGVAGAFYAALRLWGERLWARKLLLLATVGAGALLLCSWQLAATAQGQAGSARGGALDLAYAGLYSLPPENLLTLLTPFPFGGMDPGSYRGRGYLWEMELFLGVTALVMAILGAWLGVRRKEGRTQLILAALALLMLVLALGRHTPLFPLLFDHLPGFAYFRGHSKWILPASIFLIALAARGFDRFLADPTRPRGLPWALGGTALLLGGVAAAVGGADRGLSPGLLLAALTLLLLAALTYLARRWRWVAAGAVTLAVAELFLFDRALTVSFPLEDARLPQVAAFLRERPGDYRILARGDSNSAMSTGGLDIWGYDPFAPRVFTRFMARAQGMPPETRAEGVPLRRQEARFDLLRHRYVFDAFPGGRLDFMGPFPHLPHALVAPGYALARGEDEAVDILLAPGFDPWRTVVLEEDPLLPPGPSATPAPARVETVSTDELVVEAEADRPAILLLTDQYHPGWRAEALPGSSQGEYRIMRGDAFLTAIPVGTGRHRLRLVFDPPVVRWGRVVSLASLAIFLALAGWSLRRREGKEEG